MAQNCSKASKRVFNATTRTDVDALSPQARYRVIVLDSNSAMVVQNASRILTCTVPFDCVINAVWFNFQTIPVQAGGTATAGLSHVATDGSTATVIVTAATVLTGYTARVAKAQTLAATNPTEIVAGTTLELTVSASNDAVGTADVGFSATIRVTPVEDDPISD